CCCSCRVCDQIVCANTIFHVAERLKNPISDRLSTDCKIDARAEVDAARFLFSTVARKTAARGFEVVEGCGDLLEIVATLGLAGCLASGLHGRQEQGYKHTDDGNDD